MTFRRITYILCSLLVLANLAFAATPINIGILAYRGPDEAVGSWGDLPGHLEKAIPGYRFTVSKLDGPALREAVRMGKLEFVLTNPSQYVALAADFGIQRIATIMLPEAISPEQAIGSAIVTLAERKDILDLEDLRHKRIVAVAADAFGGYLAGARELLRTGIDLETGDARILHVGFPMRLVLEALQRGEADAAIVRTCLLEQLAEKGQLHIENFKVIARKVMPEFRCAASTPLYPDWAMAVARGVDRDLAKSVALALLSLPPSPTGLTWGVPADYQSVNDLYHELMLGPYASLRTTTVRGLLKSYRPYLLAVLLLLIGIIVHVIRVEYLIMRRTSQLQAAQARTRELEREAEHMAKLSILGEMSGTLAHELNQPLATIATYAQGLERRCTAGTATPEIVAEVNQEIVAQTERAAGVIRRVRAFTRKRVAARERKLIIETVQEAIDLLATLLPKLPTVIFSNHLSPDAMIEADHLQVQQVLLNLMKNAADAMEYLPLSERRIEVLLEPASSGISIAVADRGQAISQDTLDHLFQAFFTTKPDGLGLGLAICKSIVEAHGGRLEVERRQPPPGLIFRFNLPQSPDHPSAS